MVVNKLRHFDKIIRRVCIFMLALSLFTVSGCDMDWEKDSEEAYRRGVEMENRREYDKALEFYQLSLKLNPYHILANLHMGEILEVRFLNENLAVEYYRRYLDLTSPRSNNYQIVNKRAELLMAIKQGNIEDPADAAKDIMWASSKDSRIVFIERIHSRLISRLSKAGIDIDDYRKTWNDRLTGQQVRFVFRDIFFSKSGLASTIVIELADGSNIAKKYKLDFRLSDSNRTLWQLSGEREVYKGENF